MRKWGILIIAFYAFVVVILIVPAAVAASGAYEWSDFFPNLFKEVYGGWFLWMPVGILLGGQVLLLFLSVDISFKKLKPRAHVFVSCALAGILTALLASGIIWSLGFAIGGDDFKMPLFEGKGGILASWALLWVV